MSELPSSASGSFADGRPWLVFGASSAVGRFLLPRLRDAGQPVLAVSRSVHEADGGSCIRWLRGGFETLAAADIAALCPELQLLLSLGPLDAFTDWCERNLAALPASHVVAFSSLSAVWKLRSAHPPERALAQRLLDCERRLQTQAAAHGRELTLLRPSLIYGAGVDRSLSPLLRLASRLRCLPWPREADGLRQPVHADDLAAAVMAAAGRSGTATLALPGGEALAFDEMLRRALAAMTHPVPLIAVPFPMLRRASRLLARSGRPIGRRASMLHRAYENQCADPDDWTRLGIVPRGFAPDPEDFPKAP